MPIFDNPEDIQVQGFAADGAAPLGNPVLVAGSTGSLTKTLAVDSSGRLVVSPSASSGTPGLAYGEVTTTATADVPVRSTTYNEPSTNAQRSLSSSSASDASAGVGARQVKITYLDQTGAGPFTETVTLNGTTAVNTAASNICFIEKMEVVSVGSTGANVGTLTLFASIGGGGGTVGTIAAGNNQTFWAHHYVPTAKTCSISDISGHNTSTSNGTVLSLYAKTIGVATAPRTLVSSKVKVGASVGQFSQPFTSPLTVAGPSAVVLYGAPQGTPSITTRGSFSFNDA